jgi:hypothetical protein
LAFRENLSGCGVDDDFVDCSGEVGRTLITRAKKDASNGAASKRGVPNLPIVGIMTVGD